MAGTYIMAETLSALRNILHVVTTHVNCQLIHRYILYHDILLYDCSCDIYVGVVYVDSEVGVT